MAAYEGTFTASSPRAFDRSLAPMPMPQQIAPLAGAAVELPVCFPPSRKRPLPEVITTQVGGRVFHLTHVWITPTCSFFNTQEKWIVWYSIAQKVGAFFPTRHIVISRNPRWRALTSAMKALDGFRAGAKKLSAGK